MIFAHGGVQGDVSTERLPADAVPAVFAYSLNRKLRKLYSGEYFRYRQASGGEFDYPGNTPNLAEDVFITTIYDQAVGYGVQHAVQPTESLQPKLKLKTVNTYNYYEAEFDQVEYLDIASQGSGVSEIGQDFTITTIGDGGDFPRPMIGIWGTADRITVEPSDQATRFTFNNNLGTILDQDGKVTQCISGYDPKQNNHRVLTVKTGGAHGHITTTSQTPTFSNISIGREDQRLYKGTFSEATMHLGNLTELGSEQLFQTTRTYYGD